MMSLKCIIWEYKQTKNWWPLLGFAFSSGFGFLGSEGERENVEGKAKFRTSRSENLIFCAQRGRERERERR